MGIGIIAVTHLEVLAEQPLVALEFTVDPRHMKPPAFRGTAPPHYSSLADALAVQQPELVVIATPTDTHADLAAQALAMSSAQVLVEKPFVHDLAALARMHKLNDTLDVRRRVFVAHHFAFSPEVRWAAQQTVENPEWGPITGITSAFHDPYVLRGDQAFTSYISSWMDAGANQLSMLSRFVDLTAVTAVQQLDGGATAWCTAEYRSRGTTGMARLRTSWLTGASSKETVLSFGRSGTEIWIDHTAMTGFAVHEGDLLAAYGNDGRIPRKVAHYRPLYESLLSGQPDPVMSFDTAANVTELHHTTPSAKASSE